MVDSGATHTFVSSALVQQFNVAVNDCVTMQVTLADGSTVSSGSECVVPVMVCDVQGGALAMQVRARVVN